MKTITLDYKVISKHQSDKPEEGYCQAMVRGVDVDARTVTALVSTPNIDRYEEMVDPQAFKKWLPTFMENPVLIAGHRYIAMNGEPTVIGHWTELQITKEGLVGTAQFAKTELAEKWWQLFADGSLKAFSVGWITHAWEVREFELSKGVKKKIRVFTEVELIEISAVAIPANRESLIKAAGLSRLLTGETKDTDELLDTIRQTVKETVEDTLIKTLETFVESDGPLDLLIQEAIEQGQGRTFQANDIDGHAESDTAQHSITADDDEGFDQLMKAADEAAER